jgi:ABC-type transport system involved in multi-copper enzyme maturation permease subunit
MSQPVQQFQQNPQPQFPQQAPNDFAPPQGPAHGGGGFGQILLSEWTKIRTVRSTIWTLAVMVILIVGLALIIGATAGRLDDNDPNLGISLFGMLLAQIAAATLGVLTISAEYTTGMIRTTLTAAPNRLTVLTAKAVVFAGLMFVIGLVASLLAYAVGGALLSGGQDPTNGELVKALIGGPLYLAVLGLLGLGLGVLLRHSAGAIAAVLGIILLPVIIGPIILNTVSEGIGEGIVQYSPMNALTLLVLEDGGDDALITAWPSLILVACYALVALVAGAWRLKSRDV